MAGRDFERAFVMIGEQGCGSICAFSEEINAALRSIGVGGHISEQDNALFDSPYREAMFREVAEEVHLESAYEERCLGLINDDSTPVGQVHLGIVHLFTLAEPRVRRREQALTQAGFAAIAELRRQRGNFESWSQFVLAELAFV